MNIQCNIAMSEALRIILTHEKIEYTVGVGPHCLVVVIESKNVDKFRTVMKQWNKAINNIMGDINE